MPSIQCADCEKVILQPTVENPGLGFGMFNGLPVCYECCTAREAASLRDRHNHTVFMYLTPKAVVEQKPLELGLQNPENWIVSNWIGTISITPIRVYMHQGRYNARRIMLRVWFEFDSVEWFGTSLGAFNESMRCTPVPSRLSEFLDSIRHS